MAISWGQLNFLCNQPALLPSVKYTIIMKKRKERNLQYFSALITSGFGFLIVEIWLISFSVTFYIDTILMSWRLIFQFNSSGSSRPLSTFLIQTLRCFNELVVILMVAILSQTQVRILKATDECFRQLKRPEFWILMTGVWFALWIYLLVRSLGRSFARSLVRC